MGNIGMSEYLNKFRKRHKGYFKRGEDMITSGKWHLKSQKDFIKKLSGFKSESEAVSQMVKRLSVFINGSEGERHLPETQKYINNIVDVINIHLKRVEKYYDNNIPEVKWSQDGKILKEIDFQQEVFAGEISLTEKLDKLNISGTADSLEVVFHKTTEFATLPLKEVISNRSTDIARKIDSLDIDWKVILDNKFFIHGEKGSPYYNPRKHFFDQDKEVLQFYVSEWNKIKKGFYIDGYFIHPWLYWHLNYFKTPIPMPDKSQPIVNPPLRRNEWYFTEILKKAEAKNSGAIFIFGSRRYGKSVHEASYLLWKSLITPNAETSVTISNTKDRIAITDKISTAINNLHPAFRPTTNKEDWEKKVELGIKEVTGTKIKHCDIEITNLESGSKRATQKGAGGAPVAYAYDESGKSDFLDAYNAAKYSFKTPYGWKTLPIFTGTGSNVDITKDAERVLNDPELFDFLPMDWDLLEYKVPKEAITWKRRKFGFFVPGQMGYEDYFGKHIKTTLADFLDIKSEALSKVEFNEVNWIENSKAIQERRDILEKRDKKEYQAYCVFVPIDPEDCLMSAETNPFPVKEAKRTRARLIAEGNDTHGTALAVELYRDKDDPSKIHVDSSDNRVVATYPFTGGFIDSPIMLYSEIPSERPPDFMYVAGLDDYKQEKSDGDSIGSIVIYKRDFGLTKDGGTIVATLACRPDPHGKFHRQIHMLLDAYNAICFPENEDMDIQKYFDRLHIAYKYLGAGYDVSARLKQTNTNNRKFGWQPGKVTTPFVLGLVIDYCKREIEIKDKEGNVTDIRLGVELIEDIHLLEEIIKYKKDGNFDRIVAFGSALMYDFYYTTIYRNPRVPRNRSEVNKEQQHTKGNRLERPHFTKTKRKLF